MADALHNEMQLKISFVVPADLGTKEALIKNTHSYGQTQGQWEPQGCQHFTGSSF